MSRKEILFDLEEANALGAKISVIGIGGGGGNAINRMISDNMQKVNFVVVNTDAQDLKRSPASTKVQIGNKLTKGLGAGAVPEIGRQAALEDIQHISEVVQGADMVFITAGMGGGTGTGASPIVAQAAKEAGALVVAFVTKPFMFEGKRRMSHAERGIYELKDAVDSIVIIPNQRLLSMISEKVSIDEAFNMADQILCQSVRGISDLITNQGKINLDFADVRTIMSAKGTALMGTGSAKGENKAVNAVRMAISNPLMEDTSIDGATGVLLNITGGSDISLKEVDNAASTIHDAVDEDATIIFGMVEDPELKDEMRVMVIATGTDKEFMQQANRKIIDYHESMKKDHLNYKNQMRAEKPKTTYVDDTRKQKFMVQGMGINTKEFGVISGEENYEENLDVPTFLRRQVD